jgi:lysophospholipase L1-like esterase
VSVQKASVVACLGSSSTAGQGQAFGWIDELAGRPENARFNFKSLGVGGDFAYDALERVPAVVATDPDRIVILIGANDVLAMVFPNVARLLGGLMKQLHTHLRSSGSRRPSTRSSGGSGQRLALGSRSRRSVPSVRRQGQPIRTNAGSTIL